MKKFKCEFCGELTKEVWRSKDGKTIGMKCVKGHPLGLEIEKKDLNRTRKKEYGKREIQHPVFLVPLEELKNKSLEVGLNDGF
jgi:hypothetical protein